LIILKLKSFSPRNAPFTESHSARHSVHTLQPETHVATTLQKLVTMYFTDNYTKV
jgi:hypothetical protein